MNQATTPSDAALTLEVRDGLAYITFDTPHSRANTMGTKTLGELEKLVGAAAGRPELHGLVLRSGKPGMFVAGADLEELGSGGQTPDQARALIRRGHDLMARIESLPFPTVALIDGSCLGGGTELALAFDYRLAGSNPKVEIGLPEVNLGLIPGWGGTQRLPRLIGPSLAAELICAGKSEHARRAAELGVVFDAVPSESLDAEARRLLAWSRETKDYENVRLKKRDPVGLSDEQLSFTYAVTKGYIQGKSGAMPAPLAALDAIMKGCNLPLPEGLQVEMELFLPLAGSQISRNLISIFFTQRKMAKDTGVDDPAIHPKKVDKVGVIGAGIMGSGIAGAHVRRGVPALMTDKFPGAIDKGMHAVAKSLRARVHIGRLTEDEMLTALGKLNTSEDLHFLADRDAVIEAIIEDEPTKVALFRELDKIVRPDAAIASNTSTISISRMSAAVSRPERFAGMHFFNPVDRMQLVEVIRGEKTGDETIATLVALAHRIKKTPVVVKDGPGFLVNRILFPYLNESLVLLEEGADPRSVDKVAKAFGMPMGPITLSDVVGLDTSLYAGKVIHAAFPDRAVASPILEALVAAGRLGQKSGAGFYSYAKGSRGADDPALDGVLASHRRGDRKFEPEELTDRLFLPMLVEAARALEEGIARSPADVDMALILGIGFPPYRGGLLRWADSIGLDKILQKLARYESLGARYHPTEHMRRLAAEGKGFYPR